MSILDADWQALPRRVGEPAVAAVPAAEEPAAARSPGIVAGLFGKSR
jgi:hypothetical protein